MSVGRRRPFQQVLDDYARLEPGESDTWNPLTRPVELEHRVELLRRLAEALRVAGRDVDALRVLDVGCGNGRSTRMYLELGLLPEQLTGIDLREGALSLARKLHGGVRFLLDEGAGWPLPERSVDFVSLCTVLSSVREPDDRRELASRIARVLPPGGHLFFWDRTHALDFAGGDRLVPTEWFPDFSSVWGSPATVAGYEASRADPMSTAAAPPTHAAHLLRRR